MIMPLSFEKDRWCKRALDAVIDNMPPGLSIKPEWFEAEIDAGNLTLAAIKQNGVTVGTFIYRVEAPELVIMNLEADQGAIVLDDVYRAVDYHAMQLDCSSIRYHTMRPAMYHAGKRNGYQMEEVILRKNL